MPLPVIPLMPTWGNSISFTAANFRNKIGKGGVEGRARDGINSVSQAWDVAVNVTDRATVEAFLQARKGIEPFTVQGSAVAYICESWNWTWLGVNGWSFQAKFEQVFRLGVG
jgi:phage-related protein